MCKVCVIGGGSTYTPELLSGFLNCQDTFPLEELWLMDIDDSRLNQVGGFVKRIANIKNANFKIILTNNQQDAIRGASYVITQVRVGKMEARRQDEYLAHRHGLIGQETTGIGGMAKALRTIPVILDVARDMLQLAPDSVLLNFANPAGLVTESVFRYASDVQSVGVCNAAISTKMGILDLLNQLTDQNINPNDAKIKCLGLNHLTWFYGLEVNGVDFWPQIQTMLIEEAEHQEEPLFDSHTLRALGMLPNYYLQYYYYPEENLKKQIHWPPSRADEVIKIEEELLKQYQNIAQVDLPEDMLKRGGAYYSTVAAQLLNAHFNDLKSEQVLNVRHNGVVPGWNPDWVLELPCVVSGQGIKPLPAKSLPLACQGLVTQVKNYEILTVEAAVHGDYDAAYQALLTHPLGPPANKVKPILDELLDLNQSFLPQFK